jgi:uncharacterized Zn-binding protein involved in type VI secretion
MASPLVCNGAKLMCPFGSFTSNLTVLPDKRIMVDNQPVANVMDSKPNVNILPFGMCASLANPAVAAATSAALGVLTPQPCTPQTTAWIPGCPTVLIGGLPAVTQTCKCNCTLGLGVISVILAGQTGTAKAA